MPIQIGAKPESNFTDPIGLLTDCHRRIERFLSVIAQIAAGAPGGPLGDEQQRALDTALRYFREAAPKHAADEEETLFPRMRRMDSSDVRAVLARVDALEADHQRADRAHAEVDRLGNAWLQDGSLAAGDASRLAELMQELQELYRAHIAVEEGEVFPAAARSLEPAERAAAGQEMAARRGLVTR
jgi:hemerythrin-like domain-containing protein